MTTANSFNNSRAWKQKQRWANNSQRFICFDKFVQIRKFKHREAAKKSFWLKQTMHNNTTTTKTSLTGWQQQLCCTVKAHSISLTCQSNATTTARLNKINILTRWNKASKLLTSLIKEVTQSATRQQRNSKCPNLKTNNN